MSNRWLNKTETPEPFVVNVPEPPDFPSITLPEIDVSKLPQPLQLPPIIFTCEITDTQAPVPSPIQMDVRNLQENCVHDGVSDWCTEMWPPFISLDIPSTIVLNDCNIPSKIELVACGVPLPSGIHVDWGIPPKISCSIHISDPTPLPSTNPTLRFEGNILLNVDEIFKDIEFDTRMTRTAKAFLVEYDAFYSHTDQCMYWGEIEVSQNKNNTAGQLLLKPTSQSRKKKLRSALCVNK